MLTVLIAEADADVRKIISYALRPYTQEIFTALDGCQAITELENVAPLLLFVDLSLPQITTCGLLDKLNAMVGSRSMHVIVTTAYARRDIEEWVNPDWAILQKPFDMATLRAVIDERLTHA